MEKLLNQIQNLYENNQHQKIIDLINKLPDTEESPEIISELGRAYNNLYWMEQTNGAIHFLNKALEALLSVKNELENDYKWHYRIGYTYFYIPDYDKAQYHFEKSCDLNNEIYEENDYLQIIALIKNKNYTPEDAMEEVWNEEDITPAFYYDEKEMEFLEDFIEVNFGKIDSVFHELVSPDIHCDIYVIKPTKNRNYYTLVTGGMGAFAMNVPEDYDTFRHAELMINLPPDWDIKNNKEEKWYWPLRWLKTLARLPIEQNTYLGWGHTIPTRYPLEGTDFDCFMLVNSLNLQREVVEATLSTGKEVTFFTLVPLYSEETQFKLDYNAELLLEKFDEYDLPYPPIVDVTRTNTCIGYEPKEQPYLLNHIAWRFKTEVYDSLMNFVHDVKTYNSDIHNDLTEYNPFATLFASTQIKVMYQAWITSKDDILENEILLYEDETFAQKSKNGLYQARIIATLTSLKEDAFAAMDFLYQIHHTLANKELGDHVFFKGFELEGREDNGTPLLYLLLGN